MEVNMLPLLFWGSVLIEILYIILFVLTIRRAGFRFWPPPSPRSWQFFAAWILAGLVFAGFFFVGLLDFDSAFLRARARFPLAIFLHLTGAIIGTWAFKPFGLRATIGLGNELIASGPYRYSRNPQYLGDMLHILGWMLITNSWRAWIIGTLGIILNLLAPLTEEPWLEDRFGQAYLDYKHRVPRFI